ncbi:MAG: N-acyl homoserine lactonase family protein [Planctomycetes bacterium]|nr:N-acyl homoserine lactonase family protein [Planctomycetota bacterium]
MNKIHILKYGDWFAPGATVYDHAYGIHDPQIICMTGYLVQTPKEWVMVDTGIDNIDQTYTEEDLKNWNHLGKSSNTEDHLNKLGIGYSDISTVLVTHLHFDHYYNAPKYEKAQFYINKKEWEYVMDPANECKCPASGFPQEQLKWLANEAFDRVNLVDNVFEYDKGITMNHTGGHTPGHMVVSIETDQGKAIVVGDAIYLYEHIEKNIPLGYRTNLDDLMEGYRWLRDQDAILLPAHDYKVYEKFPTGIIGTSLN